MTQMFFVIGALILLGSAVMGINQMLLIKTTTMLDAEASLAAASIGQTMIDEIMAKNFDQVTDSGYGADLKRVYSDTVFTLASALGPEPSDPAHVPALDTANSSGVFQSALWYNDVDDYNNYRRVVRTPVLGRFFVTDTIYYVSETNPDQLSGVQTHYKKIIVSVTHRNMEHALRMSDVVVYRRYF